jgi:hypothetical protein
LIGVCCTSELYTSVSWDVGGRTNLKLTRYQGQKKILLLLFLDLGTKWGEWSASNPGRALAPGKDPSESIELTQRLKYKSFASAGDGTPDTQSVVRQY